MSSSGGEVQRGPPLRSFRVYIRSYIYEHAYYLGATKASCMMEGCVPMFVPCVRITPGFNKRRNGVSP